MPRIVQYAITAVDGSIQRSGETFVRELHTIVVDGDVDLEWIRKNCRAKKNYEHPTFPGYYGDTIRPKLLKRFAWEVDVTYTPFQFEPIPDNPLEARPLITYDGSLVVEPTNFDSKGYPICTSAGEFISGVERDRPVRVYHVSKNYADDPPWLDEYLGAVNADAVKIRGKVRNPGTLKLANQVAGDYITENRVRYFTLSFDLIFDPRGHKVERWNYGTLQLVQRTINKKKKWFQEQIKTGSPPRVVDEPVALDRKGQVLVDFLKSSDDGRPVDVSKLVKLSWNVQPVLPFNGVLPLR